MKTTMLSEVNEGALQERFEIELAKVMRNINDPNTDHKAARSVTIKLSFKPDEKRSLINTGISVTSTLAVAKKLETNFVMGMDNDGNIFAQELVSGVQGQMFIDRNSNIATDTGEVISEANDTMVVDFQKKKLINEE